MIKVHFNDGTTLAFDLSNPDDLNQWLEWSNVKDFQAKITGMGILHNKKFHTLPFPKNFRHVRFHADILTKDKNGTKRQLGERLVCQADEVKLSLLVYTYTDPPPPIHSRVDMERMNRRKWEHGRLFDQHAG